MCVICSKSSFFCSGGFEEVSHLSLWCIMLGHLQWSHIPEKCSCNISARWELPIRKVISFKWSKWACFSIIWTKPKIFSAGVTTQQRYQIGVDGHREAECKRMEFQLAEDRQIPAARGTEQIKYIQCLTACWGWDICLSQGLFPWSRLGWFSLSKHGSVSSCVPQPLWLMLQHTVKYLTALIVRHKLFSSYRWI